MYTKPKKVLLNIFKADNQLFHRTLNRNLKSLGPKESLKWIQRVNFDPLRYTGEASHLFWEDHFNPLRNFSPKNSSELVKFHFDPSFRKLSNFIKVTFTNCLKVDQNGHSAQDMTFGVKFRSRSMRLSQPVRYKTVTRLASRTCQSWSKYLFRRTPNINLAGIVAIGDFYVWFINGTSVIERIIVQYLFLVETGLNWFCIPLKVSSRKPVFGSSL